MNAVLYSTRQPLTADDPDTALAIARATLLEPYGLDEAGLPVGVQVMAPPMADDRLYRVGAALERIRVGELMGQAPSLAGSMVQQDLVEKDLARKDEVDR